MKGRVRRSTIEGTVLEIKTKNYISYLQPFLIWFCEKEQHKEGERCTVPEDAWIDRARCAEDAQTTRGRCVEDAGKPRRWCAEDAHTACGWCAKDKRTARGRCAEDKRTACGRRADSADGMRIMRRTRRQLTDCARTACEQCGRHANDKRRASGR